MVPTQNSSGTNTGTRLCSHIFCALSYRVSKLSAPRDEGASSRRPASQERQLHNTFVTKNSTDTLAIRKNFWSVETLARRDSPNSDSTPR